MPRREHHIAQPQGDRYLFNFPLTEDGLNYGNLPESTYIGKLRNYGSTSITPNFNDNLTFDSTYGQLAHKHTNNTDKLVALIDYGNFDFGAWMNDNDFFFNLDFFFSDYRGYQQILEMMRNPLHTTSTNFSIGIDGRWLSNNFGYLFYDGTSTNIVALKSNISTYVTNAWIRLNIHKESGLMTITYTNLDTDTVISEKIVASPTFLTNRMPRYITLFGFYQENGGNNSSRYCIGATKNFYMQKL